MKRASLIIAALALSAGLAAAQTDAQSRSSSQQAQPSDQTQTTGRPTQHEAGGVRTDYGQDRRVKKGTDQTYNTGAAGQEVGKDQPATASGQDQGAATTAGANRADGARGTGVATGFVAAGVGLAILGLFVRRKGRHDYRDVDRDDDDLTGGSGTQTRM